MAKIATQFIYFFLCINVAKFAISVAIYAISFAIYGDFHHTVWLNSQ